MRNDGVQGVVCADEKGAFHCGQGTLDERSAVHLAEIADLAASLELDSLIEPVISIQSEESRLLVRRYNGIVVAVHKTI